MSRSTRVAFVTGGSDGIGLQVVRRFLEAGWEVHYCDVEPAREDVSAATYYQCDVSSLEQVAATVEALRRRLDGRAVHALVNNAGVNLRRSVREMEFSDWDRVIRTDLYGPFYFSKLMLDLLAKADSVIINIGSDQTVIAKPGKVAYCAAKGGVLQLTRALAVDLADDGIRCVCVSPGPIDTRMYRMAGAAGVPDLPARRLGTAAEVAELVHFVARPEASFINGANLLIDGGVTAQ
jgi:NAD(P)-dependent dehydrogenase (short-subunit alcohol dehydrogenase family)